MHLQLFSPSKSISDGQQAGCVLQAAEVLQSLEPTRAWSVMGDQLCQHLVDNARTFVPALLARGDRAPATLTQVLSWLLRDRQLASR